VCIVPIGTIYGTQYTTLVLGTLPHYYIILL